MSKPVKNLITDSYKTKFADRDGVVLIDVRGIKASDNVAMRAAFAEKGVKVTVVKNTQAKRATEGTAIAAVDELLDGAVAFVYTIDPEGSVIEVARTLVEQKKTSKFIEIKGAVMDNNVFASEKAVEALSKYPTREEAVGKIAGALMGPGSSLLSALKGPGSAVGSLLKTIEEKGGELQKAG